MNRLLEPDRRRQVRALPRERSVHRNRIQFRPAPDDSKIFLGDALLLHEQAETSRGGGVFRYEDQPAGFAIEPVDDRNLPAIGDLESEQLLQLAPKRARMAGFRRMHQQERRLFHDDEFRCLGNDGEIGGVCARCFAGG